MLLLPTFIFERVSSRKSFVRQKLLKYRRDRFFLEIEIFSIYIYRASERNYEKILGMTNKL